MKVGKIYYDFDMRMNDIERLDNDGKLIFMDRVSDELFCEVSHDKD